MTSARKRTSICEVVCPLMARLTKPLRAKKSGCLPIHPSVIELPISTARGAVVCAAFSCSKRAKLAQSSGAWAAAVVARQSTAASMRSLPFSEVFMV